MRQLVGGPVRRLIGAVLLLSSTAARAGDEIAQAAGGNAEELRAVLALDANQFRDLQLRLTQGAKEYESIRTTLQEKGANAALDERKAWGDRLRGRVREVLTDSQRGRYDAWLEFKRRLAGEYDKALFGIPTVTEMKLRLELPPESVRKMQRASDQGAQKIEERVRKFKDEKASPDDIAKAVNELRRSTIEKMIESVSGAEQKRVKEFVKSWLQTAEAKLAKATRDRLVRTLKTLEAPERVRARLAAVLLHQEETIGLRRGLGKELVLLVLRAKSDAEVWETFHEYTALIAVHTKRLESLYADLKADLPTKQIAKLVSEGILE